MGWWKDLKQELRSIYNSSFDLDDGTVLGAVSASFNIIVGLPCQAVWGVFKAPCYYCSGDILPMGCLAVCVIVAIVPLVITFVVALPFAAIGALCASIYGTGRNIKRAYK